MFGSLMNTETCTYCPKLCRDACPVSNVEGNESLIPQQKMATLGEMAVGLRTWTNDFTSVLYACTGCLRCQTACEHHIDVESTLFAGRALAKTKGVGHPALKDFAARFRKHSPKEITLLQARFGPYLARQTELAYLPGCDALDLVEPTLKLLEHVGFDVCLAKLPFSSAGHTLLAAGEEESFHNVAQATAEALAPYRTVVVSCPACAHDLARRYGELGHSHKTRVLHVTELLAPRAATLTPTHIRRKIAYHDACYLGRHLGVYEPPRTLLSRATDAVVEFAQTRETAVCAGSGGLVSLTAPDTARAIAQAKMQEAWALGADTIATACPTSRKQLRAAGTVAVLDIVELFATANPHKLL